jgi:hypothetical protein
MMIGISEVTDCTIDIFSFVDTGDIQHNDLQERSMTFVFSIWFFCIGVVGV